MQTQFQNLAYLEKALTLLDISYQKETKVIHECHLANSSLVIPQSNGHSLEFLWNEQAYELKSDASFWKQSTTVTSFIEKITKQYVEEIITSESGKLGFQPVKRKEHSDGSYTLFLERWND
jgi:hypothetical protein